MVKRRAVLWCGRVLWVETAQSHLPCFALCRKTTPNKQRAAKPYKMAMNWAQVTQKDQQQTQVSLKSYQLLKKLKTKLKKHVAYVVFITQLPLIISILFKTILKSEYFPVSWSKGPITAIYKSGDKSDPSNYRGTTMRYCDHCWQRSSLVH